MKKETKDTKSLFPVVQRGTLHLVLAPQDPKGLAEFKGPLKGFGPVYAVIYQEERDYSHAIVLYELVVEAQKKITYALLLGEVGNFASFWKDVGRFSKHDFVVVASDVEVLRKIGKEALINSPKQKQVETIVFTDNSNLLTISGSLFNDGSVEAEIVAGAIPIGMRSDFSRALRDPLVISITPVKFTRV